MVQGSELRLSNSPSKRVSGASAGCRARSLVQRRLPQSWNGRPPHAPWRQRRDRQAAPPARRQGSLAPPRRQEQHTAGPLPWQSSQLPLRRALWRRRQICERHLRLADKDHWRLRGDRSNILRGLCRGKARSCLFDARFGGGGKICERHLRLADMDDRLLRGDRSNMLRGLCRGKARGSLFDARFRSGGKPGERGTGRRLRQPGGIRTWSSARADRRRRLACSAGGATGAGAAETTGAVSLDEGTTNDASTSMWQAAK